MCSLVDFLGNADDRTPPGTVHILMPNTQLEPLQPSDLSEQPRSENGMPMDVTGSVTEVAQVEDVVVSMEVQKDDPLSSFLPPPPSTECPPELQVSSHLNLFLPLLNFFFMFINIIQCWCQLCLLYLFEICCYILSRDTILVTVCSACVLHVCTL